MNPDEPTIFLFERGINGWASIIGAWNNWPNQAIVWTHTKTSAKAQTLSYFTGPFTAGLTRHRRAQAFSKLMRAYTVQNWNVHLVCHSEGTATGLEAMRLAGWPKIETVHLICGACDSNFERNGLNYALRTGKIGKVFCYRADDDGAMKLEDTVLGLAMFGISWNDLPLGLSGPVNVGAGLMGVKVLEHHWPDYGHSTCFEPSHFIDTMELVMENSLPAYSPTAQTP